MARGRFVTPARLGAFCLLMLVGTTVGQPVEWSVCVGGNGHWYEYVAAQGITWDAARVAAESAGGYLATVTSAEESTFATGLIDIAGVRGAWLGAQQPNPADPPADGWEWVTGEIWSFTNWDPGEPNDSGGSESHLEVWGPNGDGPLGTWNDEADLGNIHGYVVEYDSVPGHTYSFVPAVGITWDDARAAAEAMGGYLVTVTSAGENAIVADLINISGVGGAWLNAHQPNPADPPDEGWEWLTGEAWCFTNWESGEPNDFGGSEFWLEMWGSDGDGPLGTWNDENGTAWIGGYVVEFQPENIPAVSEWGVVVMMVLVLTAGTIILGCRRPAGEDAA